MSDGNIRHVPAGRKAPRGLRPDVHHRCRLACAYLATSLASRVTGGTVYVGGGRNIIA